MDDIDQGSASRKAPVLILTRRVGETLVIGSSVRVTVVGLRGNQVRIGIEAPKSVPVHRQELYERIRRDEQNRRAPQADGPTRECILNSRDERCPESTN